MLKYVNMTDVISEATPGAGRASAAAADDAPLYELIELLFFAYRDFVGGPDRILAEFGFGRAHHRVLHFVNRNPGIRVTDLLDILRITKQSLGRVLKQLLDTGYLEQRPGPVDRRQRLLFPTDAGRRLALRLAALQSDHIRKALDALGPDGAPTAQRFLALLVNDDDRDAVLDLVGGGYDE